ncbi:MAG: ABC transporter ATP-binding protein [Saprospiraceae bacterium]|nr:ABC transporter ATP-binding protein [Saprospiraceae bacterium]
MKYDIEVDNISKKFVKPDVQALEDINFNVKTGSLFGLIGADGAGKTTLFRILTTLLLADKGSATVHGRDVVKDFKILRSLIGYMPGRFSLYTDLSVEENLQFFATLHKTTIDAGYHLIKDIYQQIEPFKNRRAGQLSGGMKQKLALSCALIHQPKVLFLDEPTTGVDAVSRKEFWNMLKNIKNQGVTILVSTPYMDEAVLCDEIALIQNGKILSIAPPSTIIDQFPDVLYSVSGSQIGKLLEDVSKFQDIKSCFSFGDTIHVTLKQGDINGLQKELIQRGHPEVVIDTIVPTIEDCFIRLMQ